MTDLLQVYKLVGHPESESHSQTCIPDPPKTSQYISVLTCYTFGIFCYTARDNRPSENCLSEGKFTVRHLGNLIEPNFKK